MKEGQRTFSFETYIPTEEDRQAKKYNEKLFDNIRDTLPDPSFTTPVKKVVGIRNIKRPKRLTEEERVKRMNKEVLENFQEGKCLDEKDLTAEQIRQKFEDAMNGTP